MATKILRPSSAGDKTELSCSGINYQATSDQSDSTYVYQNSLTTEKTDLYNTIFGEGALEVSQIEVFVRVKQTVINSNDGINIEIKTGGTEYESIRYSLSGTSWADKSNVWITNPKTGVAWTQSDIEALQIGVYTWSILYEVGPQIQISEVWVVVTYTPLNLPTVTTQAVTNILSTTATGNGNITNTGGENCTKRGICYNLTGNPTVADSKVEEMGSFGTGAFTESLINLSPGTTHHVKAYAYNSAGYGYGAEEDFITLTPTVTTQAVTDILSTTSTGNGNTTITGGQNSTKRGVCWNTTGSPTVVNDKSEEIGSFGTGAFTRPMTGLNPNITYYVKAYIYNLTNYYYGAEVSFTTLKTTPTVTVQAPTDLAETTVTANGNITASGGENATVRGFKYGLTQTDTWDAHTNGSFPIGTFTKGLTGLDANTTYWIRAYATNSIGTSYSGWIQFQTAASGIIPTGTKLSICSDYSGYTYKLNSAFTDDGETYESFFVLSTDLANSQALNIFKRLLDLNLYFESEDMGTVEIYVKCDDEADWEYLGSVDLTGTADIIVLHLPVDVRAKHFLLKVSASNYFKFIGCIFEFILLGGR